MHKETTLIVFEHNGSDYVMLTYPPATIKAMLAMTRQVAQERGELHDVSIRFVEAPLRPNDKPE